MRSSLITITMVAFVCACCASGFAQNLLNNGGFENAGEPCASGNGWTKVPGTNNCLQDGTTWMPPGHFEGLHHGSVDMGNPSASDFAIITQTVTLAGSGDVRLTGAIAGYQSTGSADHFARIHDGAAHTDAVIAEFIILTGGWHAIDIAATPTGSQVTVSWGWDNVVPAGYNQATASHLDGLVLTQEQAGCTGEPTIIQIIPTTFGTNDGTLDEVVVIGTNFDETSQVLLRRTGFVDVEATGESVGGGGTAITCSLPLDGVAMGKWNLVVTKDLCNEALLNNGFIVAVPTLTNGSFEDPSAPASCPNPPAEQDAPLFWLDGGVATAPDLLIRDSDQYPPSCPRPDGDHYASMMVPQGTSFGFWRTYQYIAVTPGQQVTVCGQFAGGGTTNINLRILEGDEDGERIGQRLVEYYQRGCELHEYDWLPACVSASPTNGLITVEWAIGARGTGEQVNVTHADHLVMTQGPPPAEVCDDGIDNDGDRATDCLDSDCVGVLGCGPVPVEICDNGIDDDGDVLIDCFDEDDCLGTPACYEICNDEDDNGNCEVDDDCEDCENGVDDNDDGLTDCDDPICADFPGCGEACGNGVDDDGDGLIDCLDDDCDDSPFCPCSDPFADPDSDGDVDHEDFGNLQLCLTGPLGVDPPALPLECVCFDRDGDRDIDQVDVTQFEKCATGPMIPFDIENPPEDCIP